MSLLLTYGVSPWLLVTVFVLPILIYIMNKLGQDEAVKGKKLPPKAPVSIWGLIWASLMPSTNFQKVFAKFGEQGPLHMQYLPWPKLRMLFINDFDMGKQFFNTTTFSGRPENEFWRYYAKGGYGIVSSDGKVWEEQRRFTLRKLKDMGMGSKSMDRLIAIEVEQFLDTMATHKGKVFTPNKIPSVPTLNTIWVVLTGKRFTPEDINEQRMIHCVYEAFSRVLKFPQVLLVTTHKGQIYFSMKTIAKILTMIPIKNTLSLVIVGFDKMRNYCTSMIAQRRKQLADGLEPDSFLDDYLKEIEGTTNEKSSFYQDAGAMNLQATISDFLIAGGDTAANTMAWAMLHLIRNPEVQAKVQAEIDAVVGRERRPTLLDKPNCPYTTAFLLEVLRSTPVGLFSLPHRTMEDTEIGSYFIPKNTTVVVNIAAVHANEKIWGDPKAFRPERFLSPDGKTLVKNEAMIAFSIGKRKCPGAALALDNLYLFLSATCQKFTLKKDPNLKGRPSLKPVMSMLSSPSKYYMIIEERE